MTASDVGGVLAVLTTAPETGVAETIAETLVAERLAACANIVPGATSIYRWDGAIQREAEVMIVLKTTAAISARLRDRLVELHPYDVPEVIAFDVSDGSRPYLDWVRSEVEQSA